MSESAPPTPAPDHSADPPSRSPAPWYRSRWVLAAPAICLIVMIFAAFWVNRDDSDSSTALGNPAGVGTPTPTDDAPAVEPTRPALPPPQLTPAPPPAGESFGPEPASCFEILDILDGMVGSGLDGSFVESRRTAAAQIRALTAPTAGHQAAWNELADALDDAAQMVEDGRASEDEAADHGWQAYTAMVESGGCD